MSRPRLAYLAASALTVGAGVWAVWWMTTPGLHTAALLPIAVVAIGAEAIRRTWRGSDDHV